MGDKLVAIIVIPMLVWSITVAIAVGVENRKSERASDLISEFTQVVQYRGIITKQQYIELVDRIPYKSFKVQITYIDKPKSGSEDIMDIYFPYQVKNSLDNHDKFVMKTGGQVKVDLIVKDRSALDTMIFMKTKRANRGTKLIKSCSGAIVNEKY